MLGLRGGIPDEKVGAMTPSAPDRARAKAIAKEIAAIGFVLPGTLSERYLTCTHAGCHCHGDPPQLHGPYWYWTRKVDAKTVSKMLSPDQVADYRRVVRQPQAPARARRRTRSARALGRRGRPPHTSQTPGCDVGNLTGVGERSLICGC